jgi:hypothetical protein
LSHRNFAAKVYFTVEALVRRLQLLRDVKHRQLCCLLLTLLSWSAWAAEKIPLKIVTCELLLHPLRKLASSDDAQLSLKHIRSRVEYRVGADFGVSLEPVLYDGFTSDLKKEPGSEVLRRLNMLVLSLEKNPDIQIVALEFRGKENIERALQAALTLEPELSKTYRALLPRASLFGAAEALVGRKAHRIAREDGQHHILIRYLQQLIQEPPSDRFFMMGSNMTLPLEYHRLLMDVAPTQASIENGRLAGVRARGLDRSGSTTQEQSAFLDHLVFFDGETLEPVWIAIYRVY